MIIIYIAFGLVIGIVASFLGVGGGLIMVPLLLFMGKPSTQAVGTSFLAILLISLSALIAHNKLNHVDYIVGLCLAGGGIVGAQLGSRLVAHVSTQQFQKIFAVILFGMAIYLFLK